MKVLICLVILGSLFIISCSSVPMHEKWIKDGNVVGDITRYKRNYGYACNYKNSQGRLERFEKRDDKLVLLPGDCCADYSYDTLGRMTEEIIVNDQGQTIVGCKKFAIHKIAYSKNADGDNLTEHSYFNAEETPVTIPDGFHRQLIQTDSTKGKTESICFFNVEGNPASATYSEVGNVSEVDFKYVNGIGEVCIGIFKDPQKKIIKRKKLSGRTSFTTTNTTTTYHSHY